MWACDPTHIVLTVHVYIISTHGHFTVIQPLTFVLGIVLVDIDSLSEAFLRRTSCRRSEIALLCSPQAVLSAIVTTGLSLILHAFFSAARKW